MNKLFVFTLCLLLAGCATQQKVVYVPTPVACPKPKIAPEPKWPALSKNASAPEFVKFCVTKSKLCDIEHKACRIQLEGRQ